MKRNVKLNTFEDLLEELEKIEKAKEIKTYGVWSVYQILEHLSENLYGSLHGFPKQLPKIVRMTIGKFMLGKILKSGYMRSGYPNPNSPKKREEGDILSSLQKLRSIIDEFRNHTGSFAMHPIFDALTVEQWTSLHLIHFSLHLGYIEVVGEEKTVPPPAENSQGNSENSSESKKEEYRPAYTLSETEIIIEDEDEEPPVHLNGGKEEISEQELSLPETEQLIISQEITAGISEDNPPQTEKSSEQEKETLIDIPDATPKKKPGSKKTSSPSSKKKSEAIGSPTPPLPKAKKKGAAKKK